MAEHDVGGLAADAGQFDERVHRGGHLAAMLVDERLRHADEARDFIRKNRSAESAARALRVSARGERAGVRIAREQRGRDLVHARVGALRRQDRRHEQLVRRSEVQLGPGVRDAALSRRSRDRAARDAGAACGRVRARAFAGRDLSAAGPWASAGRAACAVLDRPQLFLQRRNQAGHDAERQGDARDDRRSDGLRRFGLLMSCSDSGRTSQKVSVRSNGVCATAQKLA